MIMILLFLVSIVCLCVLKASFNIYPYSSCQSLGFPLTKRMAAKNDYSKCKIIKFRLGFIDLGICIFSLSDGIMKIESFEIKEGKRFKGYGKKFFNFLLSYAKKQDIRGIYLITTPCVHSFYSKCKMDLLDLDTYYIAFINVCKKVNWLEVLEKYL